MKNFLRSLLALLLGALCAFAVMTPVHTEPAQPDSSATALSSTTTISSTDNETTITDPYGAPLVNSLLDLQSNFPLVAALPEDDFYLYGIYPYGMVLYHSGQGQYFNWPGLTPRQILPEMSYFDYDGDGEKELAVTLYWGSGTGVAMMDLHILKIDESNDSWLSITYHDYAISSLYNLKTVDKLLNEKFPFSLEDGGKTVQFTFNGKLYSVQNEYDPKDTGAFQKIAYGSIIEYKIQENHRITVNMAIGFDFKNWAEPMFFADVTADVSFDGKNFKFNNKTINFDGYN